MRALKFTLIPLAIVFFCIGLFADDKPIKSPTFVEKIEAKRPPMGVEKENPPMFHIPGGEDAVMVNRIASIEPNSSDWWNTQVGTVDAWKKTRGAGIRVCVLDTGVDSTHPDLKVKDAKDFTGSRTGTTDIVGHGTHCAGIIAASGEITGIAPEAELYCGKVLDDSGSGLDTWIAAGLKHAREVWKVHVISMSLGARDPSPRTYEEIKLCRAAGILIVAAAGNSGPGRETAEYPGSHPECICVAALDKANNLANFSSRGIAVDVAGYGVNIRSTYPGKRYATMSGTSMATPQVAGVVCLGLSAGIKSQDLFDWLSKACDDIAPIGRDTGTGYGLLKADKLVALAPTAPVIPPVNPPDVPPGVDIIIKSPELENRGIDSITVKFKK